MPDTTPSRDAVREALESASAAIMVAVTHEDGLDGGQGATVLRQIDEALAALSRTSAEPPSTDAVVVELPKYTKDALSRAREHFMRLYLEKMDKDQGELAKLYGSTIDGIDEIAVALGWRVPPDSKLYQHPAPTAPVDAVVGEPVAWELWEHSRHGKPTPLGGTWSKEDAEAWTATSGYWIRRWTVPIYRHPAPTAPTPPDASGGEDDDLELALRPDTEAERAAAFMEACGSRYSAPHIRRHYELAAAALRTPDSAVPAPDGRENDG